jgi:hypothetical protein
MLVHERQHDDLILFDHVEERIPEPAEYCSPNYTFDPLVQLWMRPQMRLGSFEVLYEC